LREGIAYAIVLAVGEIARQRRGSWDAFRTLARCLLVTALLAFTFSACSSDDTAQKSEPEPTTPPVATELPPEPPAPDLEPEQDAAPEPAEPCEDDEQPYTTSVSHAHYGCGQRWELPDDPDAAWIEFESSVHLDEATGIGWTLLPLDLPWADHEQECASLELMGIGRWRLPTIDETRRLGAGCDNTATGGRCPVSDPECLQTSCNVAVDIDSECWSCRSLEGPHENTTYCRPNVRLCTNLQTSSSCDDCAGETWMYGVTNGNFLPISKMSPGTAACVREALPGFRCSGGSCSEESVDVAALAAEREELEREGQMAEEVDTATGCSDGDTRCDEQVPMRCAAGQWTSLPECNGGTQRCNPDTATCDCADDMDPDTSQYTHAVYGCARVWDLPNDAGAAWTEFDSGIHFDAETGLAWTALIGSYPQAQAITRCEMLEVAGVDGWRLPSIDDYRNLSAGCPATAPDGSCGVWTDGCLERACAQQDGCNGCVGREGPGVEGTYCRPNVQLCSGSYTTTECTDCNGDVWSYSVGNGGFSTTDATLGRGVKCIREGLPEL
jgi:hypothetical protein